MSHFLRSYLRQWLPSFGIAIMILYFGYHALNGDQSVLKWYAYKQSEQKFTIRLSELSEKQAGLVRQNQLLRSSSLDLDYLEERTRDRLGYVHPEDRILPVGG